MGSELNISPGGGRYYRKAFTNEISGAYIRDGLFSGDITGILRYFILHLFYLVRTCVPLVAPRDGVIVGVCNSEYLSVCRISCNEGYEAVGSVERRCVENKGYMTWTGTPMYCQGKAQRKGSRFQGIQCFGAISIWKALTTHEI